MVFFESIKIFNGQVQNINYHNLRFNRTRKEWFGIEKNTDLEELISVPPEMSTGLVKCRIFYGQQIEGIEFEVYKPRSIASLKLIGDNDIDYAFKFANRTSINRLFDQRGNCDDVLIIKKGMITDTSSANVVFWDSNRWITPANPLLKGTKRQYYIEKNIIRVKELRIEDICRFKYISLINAMLDLGHTNVKTESVIK
ncbi:MAG: hypothetical protein FJY07_10385 [Bacteroidetes bacterium]|nr:hypothetical protein [Bacteroidota bacterium]